jgi:hypothetical protein
MIGRKAEARGLGGTKEDLSTENPIFKTKYGR